MRKAHPLFSFNNFYLFIYFWLRWVFTAARVFSGWGEQGPPSSCGECSFSLQWHLHCKAQTPGPVLSGKPSHFMVERQLIRWLSGKESASQCRRHRRCRFDPWVGKILEEEMITHCNILAWRTPWTEEPGGL